MKNKTKLEDGVLLEFKDLITKKKGDAETNLTFLKNQHKEQISGGSPDMNLIGINVNLQKSANDTIINCKNALARIENETFGIDFITKKLIPIEQLRANPFLTREIKQPVALGKKLLLPSLFVSKNYSFSI